GWINTKNGPQRIRIPNGQMYHVHVDNRVPYWIYSNRQDDGTMRGPSTSTEETGNGCLPENSAMPASLGGFFGRGGRGGGRGAGARRRRRGGAAGPADPERGPGRGRRYRATPRAAWQAGHGGGG